MLKFLTRTLGYYQRGDLLSISMLSAVVLPIFQIFSLFKLFLFVVFVFALFAAFVSHYVLLWHCRSCSFLSTCALVMNATRSMSRKQGREAGYQARDTVKIWLPHLLL